MSDEKKRKALRTYFSPPRLIWPIIVLLIGLPGLGLTRDTFLPAIVVVVIAGIWLLFVFQKRSSAPSDQQVDQWFYEDVKRIAKQSLSKLGLDESMLVREAIPVTGPILWTTNGVPDRDLLWRKGKDDIVRFAVNRISVLQFTDQVIAAYACDFNFLKNVPLNDNTDEFHYLDIVSVSTKEDSTSYTLPTGTRMVHSQAFSMSVSSGESIKVTIDSDKLAEITKGTIPITSAEKAVQVIRTMLREKKQVPQRSVA